MSKKFQIICCDPPFSFKDTLQQSDVKRGAAANYSTLTMSEIEQLPVKDIADPEGALLALWVPSSLLQEGLNIMKAWSFTQKQTYIWVKIKKHAPYKKYAHSPPQDQLSFGMGRLMRQTHEICLIGINNNKIYKHLKNKSQRSVSFGENIKHSAKPSNLQDSLEIMFPDVSKIEIFGRRLKDGWHVIGNQSPTTMDEDIRVSLQKLIDE